MRKFCIALICPLLFIACDKDESVNVDAEWKKLGLDGYTINELELRNEVMYAATDRGLFIKDINTHSEFTLLGLSGHNIDDIVVFSESEILASVVDRSYQEPPAIYETLDGGQSRDQVAHNFGGTGDEPLFDFAVSGEASPV